MCPGPDTLWRNCRLSFWTARRGRRFRNGARVPRYTDLATRAVVATCLAVTDLVSLAGVGNSIARGQPDLALSPPFAGDGHRDQQPDAESLVPFLGDRCSIGCARTAEGWWCSMGSPIKGSDRGCLRQMPQPHDMHYHWRCAALARVRLWLMAALIRAMLALGWYMCRSKISRAAICPFNRIRRWLYRCCCYSPRVPMAPGPSVGSLSPSVTLRHALGERWFSCMSWSPGRWPR